MVDMEPQPEARAQIILASRANVLVTRLASCAVGTLLVAARRGSAVSTVQWRDLR
jgi:hypothetical protein